MLRPELSADVRLIDNQASRINLPEGLVITAARFLSDGFGLTINGHVVRVLGRSTRLAFSPDGAELWWLETEDQAVDGNSDEPVVRQVNPLR